MSSYADGSKRFDEHPTWRFVHFFLENLKLTLKDFHNAGIFYGKEYEAFERAYTQSYNLLLQVEDQIIREDLNG